MGVWEGVQGYEHLRWIGFTVLVYLPLLCILISFIQGEDVLCCTRVLNLPTVLLGQDFQQLLLHLLKLHGLRVDLHSKLGSILRSLLVLELQERV